MGLSESDFDKAGGEKLPYFERGVYDVTITGAERRTFDKDWYIAEFKINKVIDDPTKIANKTGTYSKVMFRLDAPKVQAPYRARELKSFLQSALGVSGIKGADIIAIIGGDEGEGADPTALIGKKLTVSMVPQTDKDGEFKFKDDGITPWLEVKFAPAG